MKPIRTALIVFVFWTIAVGGIYPLLITGIGAVFFPGKATGSLIEAKGNVVGSSLLAQGFADDSYFHPRASAANYNAASSGATNAGYTNADLRKVYEQRKAAWQETFGPGEPPIEMLYASGSGLDPHISPLAAELQVPGVSTARHLPADKTAQLLTLVKRYEEAPQLGFLGEPRVNVLLLNLALDEAFPAQK